MLSIRQMPPFVRAAWILGLLLCLVSLVVFVAPLNNWFSMGQASWHDRTRIDMIALNLILLSTVCTAAANSYNSYARRLRLLQRPGGEAPSLAGWRRQAAGLLLLAAVPLCAITLAAVIPPTSSAFQLVFPVTILAALAGAGANIWITLRMKPTTD